MNPNSMSHSKCVAAERSELILPLATYHVDPNMCLILFSSLLIHPYSFQSFSFQCPSLLPSHLCAFPLLPTPGSLAMLAKIPRPLSSWDHLISWRGPSWSVPKPTVYGFCSFLGCEIHAGERSGGKMHVCSWGGAKQKQCSLQLTG